MGELGLGENPPTPRSPQAQPGNALLQGIATSFLVGNKTRSRTGWGQESPSATSSYLQTTLRFPGVRLPWHEDLRFSPAQASALLTLRLPGELLTAPSPRPGLSEGPRCCTPPPSAPHSAPPGGPAPQPSPEGRPRVSHTIRPHPKDAARPSAPLAGPGASRLNRCPCLTQLSAGAQAEAATGTPQSRPPERPEGTPAPPSTPQPCPAAHTDVAGLAADTASSSVVMDWCWGEGRLQDETFPDPENPGDSHRESS